MKAAKRWRAATAALAIGFVSPLGVPAESAGMLQSCWTPESLAGKPAEKLSQASHDQTPNPAAKLPTATPSQMTGSIRRVKLPPGRKLVALTFDLCEAAWRSPATMVE